MSTMPELWMVEVVRSMIDEVGVFESGLTFGNPVIKIRDHYQSGNAPNHIPLP